jgi:hypothetical protein
MRNIDLEACLVDGVNCVEVYICCLPPKKPELPHTSTTIDIAWNKSLDISKILKNYLNFKNSTEFVEFYYKDLCYAYDRANDGQRVTRKNFKKDIYTDSCYAVSYNEEVLPSHMYPCLNEQSHKTFIKRDSYRVNNRTFIVHEINQDTTEEYMYIRYNHSQNVDIKKNEIDFQRAYNTLTKRY